MRTDIAEPNGDHASSSSRDHCKRTGRPAARARMAASIAASSAPLWPKQPAPSAWVTVIRSGFMSKTRANSRRSAKLPCVCEQRVRCPPSQRASAHEGPIEACARKGRE